MVNNARKKRRLNGWRALMVALIFGLCYLIALPIRIYHDGLQDNHGKADVIIVLGARQNNGRPSAALRARLDHALQLYRQGDARYLLFTGGRMKGDVFTEAGTGRRYALRHGIPEDAILLEPRGRTTMQSLQSCKAIMRRHHFANAILVSDAFHVFRLRRMARDLGLRATTSPVPSGLWTKPEQFDRVVHEVGAYAAYRLVGM
ncbi:MAG TPA: YdcF family protein [Armatimonadota bacterium]|nr:YdcF family protein [Armatimonadota bacterium]